MWCVIFDVCWFCPAVVCWRITFGIHIDVSAYIYMYIIVPPLAFFCMFAVWFIVFPSSFLPHLRFDTRSADVAAL